MIGFIRIPTLNFKTYQPEAEALIGVRWIIVVLPFTHERIEGCEVITSHGVTFTPLSFDQLNRLIEEAQSL